jgi:hypothetical protein
MNLRTTGFRSQIPLIALGLVLHVAAAPAATPHFTERAQTAGLSNPGYTRTLTADDFDGDGDIDVFEGNYPFSSPQPSRLYANGGTGQFTLVVDTPFGICEGSVWLDMDADGDLDAITYSSNLLCYENIGGLQFVDVTAQVGLGGLDVIQADVCDFDGDSWLDLALSRRSTSGNTIEIWCRRSDIFVQEHAFPSPTSTAAFPVDAISTFDWDRDLDPDIFAHDYAAYWGDDAKTYLMGNGNGIPTTWGQAAVTDFPAPWSPYAWTDVDLDGDWDFFCGASDYHGGLNHLLVQTSPGTWVDKGVSSGLTSSSLYTSCATWGDLDLDGYPDLFQPRFAAYAGYTTSRLYRNNGNVTFTDITSALDAVVAQYVVPVVWFDSDADGDLDLLVGRGGDHNGPADMALTTNMFFRNDSIDLGHWLQVDLAGAGGNRFGRGAEIEVHVGERILLATPSGGSSPGFASNPHRVTVGLAAATTADSMVVRWRSGLETRLYNIPADQRITIMEGDAPPRLQFVDVTSGYPGLDDYGSGNSVAWVDYDNDGDLDLSMGAGGNNVNRLFLNRLSESGSVFFQSLDDPLIANPATSRGLGWGIFNAGDLCPDLYQGVPYAANVMVANFCGEVVDVTNGVTAGSSAETNGIRGVDFDSDGLLDIHELNLHAPDRLLRNLGGWQFQEMPESAISIVEGSFDAAWGDADNDGDQDVYVTREAPEANVLLRNDGDGAFFDVTSVPLAIGDRSQCATWGDYDNDGDLDLFVTNWLAANHLFRNDGGFNFFDVAVAGMDVSRRGQSAVWGDLNNDGWLDFYVANQGDPNQLWLNVPDGQGGRTFEDVTYAAVEAPGASTGVSFGDYDQDGDLDIYVGSHLDANLLLRNELSPGAHWLQVNLVGTQSNASAIGCRLTLSVGGLTMVREVGSNNGMWSQEPFEQHFGLGAATAADSIVIRWPSGSVQRIVNIPADARLTIAELAPLPTGVVFADNFDVAPSASWIVPAGGWQGMDQHYMNTNTSGFADSSFPLFNGSPDLANYSVQMDYTPTQATSAGVVLNFLINMSAPAIPWPQPGTTGYNIGFGYYDSFGITRFNGTGAGPGEPLINVPSDPRVHMTVGHTYVVVFAAEYGTLKFRLYEKGAVDPGWMYTVGDATYGSGHFGLFTWNTLGWIDNVVVTGAAQFQSSLVDVPNDQGGHLSLSWNKHVYDLATAFVPVTEYDVQRFSGGWQTLSTISATEAESYSATVATTDILTISQPAPYSRYRVLAKTAIPAIFYESRPDSAYSIDNLPPPKPEVMLYDSLDDRVIVWNQPDMPDYGGACVYRGAEPGFVAGEPVSCPSTRYFVESDLDWYFYRVQFSDIHGNLSEFSDEMHGQWPTPVPNAIPTVVRLYPCQPNPFNPRTTIKFDLPADGAARLAVFDIGGRLIRTLVDESLAGGEHEAVWDGRDASGREVASGSYLARLQFGGKVETVRLGLVR